MNARLAEAWPSGRSWAICSVAMTAEEISSRFAVHFAHELDDLGELAEAAIWEPAIHQILLTWRDHPTIRSTAVEVDSTVTRDEGLAALWRLTHLDVRDFDWVNVYARFPQPASTAEAPDASLLPRQITGLGELTRREIEVSTVPRKVRQTARSAATSRSPPPLSQHICSVSIASSGCRPGMAASATAARRRLAPAPARPGVGRCCSMRGGGVRSSPSPIIEVIGLVAQAIFQVLVQVLLRHPLGGANGHWRPLRQMSAPGPALPPSAGRAAPASPRRPNRYASSAATSRLVGSGRWHGCSPGCA